MNFYIYRYTKKQKNQFQLRYQITGTYVHPWTEKLVLALEFNLK